MSNLFLLKYRLQNNDITLKRKIKTLFGVILIITLIPIYLITTPFKKMRSLLNNKDVESLALKASKTSVINEYLPNGIVLPIDGTITSNYGYRIDPISGNYSKHTGIDISGVHHCDVRTIDSGIISSAGYQNGYGNCIEIKHSNYYSFYAHLSKIIVTENMYVNKGDIIGNEGGDPLSDPNPGYSTGHHLHFEIRTRSGYGNDINPERYIFQKLY